MYIHTYNYVFKFLLPIIALPWGPAALHTPRLTMRGSPLPPPPAGRLLPPDPFENQCFLLAKGKLCLGCLIMLPAPGPAFLGRFLAAKLTYMDQIRSQDARAGGPWFWSIHSSSTHRDTEVAFWPSVFWRPGVPRPKTTHFPETSGAARPNHHLCLEHLWFFGR